MVAANVCAETPSANGSELEKPFSDGNNRFLEALERAKRKQIEEKSQKLAQEAQDADKKSAQEVQKELQQASKSASSDWGSYKPYAIGAGAAATTLGLVGFMATKVAALAAITGPQIALIPLVAVAAGAWNFWYEKDKPVLELSPKNAMIYNHNQKLIAGAVNSDSQPIKVGGSVNFHPQLGFLPVPSLDFGTVFGGGSAQESLATHEVLKKAVDEQYAAILRAKSRKKTTAEHTIDYLVPAGAAGAFGCLALYVGAVTSPIGVCCLLSGLGYAALTDETSNKTVANDGVLNTVQRTFHFCKKGFYALAGYVVLDGKVKQHLEDFGNAFAKKNMTIHQHNNFDSMAGVEAVRQQAHQVAMAAGATERQATLFAEKAAQECDRVEKKKTDEKLRIRFAQFKAKFEMHGSSAGAAASDDSDSDEA